MNFKKICLWIVLISLILGISYGTAKFFYKEETMPVHVEKEIENSIEMKELQNQFVVIESVGFGGAGAGGQGTAQMEAKSARQFIEIIKNTTKEEWIWSAERFEATSGPYPNTYTTYTKVYWSFIKDRSGILIYEKSYYYPEHTIKMYDKGANTLYFYKNNWSWALLAGIVVFLVCIFVWAVVSEKLFYRRYIQKWEKEDWERRNKNN
jgi:hypothetical protein